jgi:hypothetical protein
VSAHLRAELDRVAGTAPVADVPAGTWARAQRARRRERAATLAADLAALAVLAALVGRLPGRTAPPVASAPDAGGAVPAYVWSVPERLTMQRSDGSWSSDRVEEDLAIGRAAVAYVAPGGLPVVVGAGNGAYHLLDLPGFLGASPLGSGGEVGLALSPDGHRLAYAWSGPAPRSDAVPMPSGIRVVDLDSGDVRTVHLVGGRGNRVSSIGWSPGSTWMVWRGRVTRYWTATSWTARGSATGRVAPGRRTSQEVPDGRGEPVVGIADDGTVTLLGGRRATSWDGRVLGHRRLPGPSPVNAAATGPSARRVAFGTTAEADAIASLDTATGRLSTHRYLTDLYPEGALSRPLGWLDDGLLVALVTPVGAADEPAPDPQIVVTTPERGPASTYRIVGRTDPAVPGNLSVAVDLMTLDRPTVERPEPRWPWSDERKAVVGGLAGLVLLGGAFGALRWRRRAG